MRATLPSPRGPAPLSLDRLQAATPAELQAAFNGEPVEAARWIAAAARYGMVEAQLLFGQILLDGRGLPADAVAARGWFRTAASAGSHAGLNMLGRCHELGWGGPADAGAARDCYARAAEAGYDWAQYNLAAMLWRGAGGPRDAAAALGWYRRAAAQGHAKSLNILARFLEEGWETPADPAAAALLYRRAAEAGDFRGQFNLGTLLAARGETTAAAQWFRRAADGSPPGFLASMAERLARRPEPELQAIGQAIAGRLACMSGPPVADRPRRSGVAPVSGRPLCVTNCYCESFSSCLSKRQRSRDSSNDVAPPDHDPHRTQSRFRQPRASRCQRAQPRRRRPPPPTSPCRS